MSTTQIVVVLVAGVAALVKSIAGVGYPLVLLPVVALFIDVADAVVIVAPANLFLNGQLAWRVRQARSEATSMNRFLLGGVAGAIVGTLLLPVLPDRFLRSVLVFVIVAFLASRSIGSGRHLSPAGARTYAAPVGVVAGVFQGAAGISGPIVTPWFLSLGLSREGFIYSIATVFGAMGVAQLLVMIGSDLFTVELLLLGAALIPVAIAMFPIGERIRNRISISVFENLVLVLLAASAVSLLFKIF